MNWRCRPCAGGGVHDDVFVEETGRRRACRHARRHSRFVPAGRLWRVLPPLPEAAPKPISLVALMLLGFTGTTWAQGLTITPSTLRVEEGYEAQYVVQLATEPTANVVVAITSGNSTRAWVDDGASLTFTPSNWNVPQIVTVDSNDDSGNGNNSLLFTHTATSTDTNYSGESWDMTVRTEERFALVLRTRSDGGNTAGGADVLQLVENGLFNSRTFTLGLSDEPSSDVTLTFSVSDASAARCTGCVDAGFTASRWYQRRYIRFTSRPDGDTKDELVTMTVTASGGGYDNVTQTIVAMVEDDDTEDAAIRVREVGATEDATSLTIDEGDTLTYEVRLNRMPSFFNVTLALSTDDAEALTTTTESLYFVTGLYARWQTVTIEAVQDDDVNDETVNVTYTATGAEDFAGEYTTPVTVKDDDGPSIVVTPSYASASENGGMAAFDVSIDLEPAADVDVTPASADPSVAMVAFVSANDDGKLNFTRANYDTAQTVTVTMIDDDAVNDPDRTTDITFTAEGAIDDRVTRTVTGLDDDATVTVTVNNTVVGEGNMGSYTVVLDSAPTADVTVSVTSGDLSVATVDSTSLTFTTSDWDTAKTVTVIGVDDDVANGSDRIATISHMAAGGGYDDATIASVILTVVNDDTAGLEVTGAATRVAEAGGADDYAVALTSQPTGDVTVSVSSDDHSVATASPSSLTFTVSNWNTPQAVTVTGVDDDVDNAPDRPATITHSATDGGYDGVSAAVTVTATDDDTRGVTVTESDGATQVAEASGTDAYTVALDSEPTADVTVAITSGDAAAATVAPSSLTFTPANWGSAQTVSVTGVNDDMDNASSRRAAIHHSVSGGDYDGLSVRSVLVTVIDDDVRGVTVTESGGATRMAEAGGTDTYAVVLDSEPTADVTIAVRASDATVAMVSPTRLTFSTSSWASAQAVTVTGVDDDVDNDPDRRTTIVHAAAGGNYDGIAIANVAVTAVDDDVDDSDPGDGDGGDGDLARNITVGYLPAKSDPMHVGFVRVANLDDEAATVSIDAADDWGVAYDPVTLGLPVDAARHFNSADLEDGNVAKGLAGATGPGLGDWWLAVTSEQAIEWQSYIRTADGFLTAVHDAVVAGLGAPATLPTLNPGSNLQQVSSLRLVNLGTDTAVVNIAGIDDAGASPGEVVTATLQGGRAISFTSAVLESGVAPRLTGSLGDGEGKWRLVVESTRPVLAMSLMSSPTGHLTNLSTVPTTDRHLAPLFPPASDPFGRQGFARVVNRSSTAGTVTIQAHDESDHAYEPLTLAIGARQTRHFNSDDLEGGNPDKGLTGSTGPGTGDWWLELTSALDIQVLSHIRTRHDGFLTSMHDVAPLIEGAHRVVTLDPVSPENQGVLRLLNPGAVAAGVTIMATDDDGVAGTSDVQLTVAARRAVNLTSDQLESGDAAFDGMLGDGEGRWRLSVTADQPIHVMSLINARQTGHLTNLSTTTR